MAGGGGLIPQYLKAATAIAALAADIGSLQRARKTRSRSVNRETTMRPNPGAPQMGYKTPERPPGAKWNSRWGKSARASAAIISPSSNADIPGARSDHFSGPLGGRSCLWGSRPVRLRMDSVFDFRSSAGCADSGRFPFGNFGEPPERRQIQRRG